VTSKVKELQSLFLRYCFILLLKILSFSLRCLGYSWLSWCKSEEIVDYIILMQASPAQDSLLFNSFNTIS